MVRPTPNAPGQEGPRLTPSTADKLRKALAIAEELKRRAKQSTLDEDAKRARDSLHDFAGLIEIPGAPVSEQDEESDHTASAIKRPQAAHHTLLLDKLEAVERGEISRLMIFMPPGSAKALDLDTPIPTPSGWKRMGDLRVGDQVFDENGKTCNVTWVSPIWRDRPVYKVTTDCGDEIIADRDHEWLVRLCGKRQVFKIKETHELCRRRSKRPLIQRAGALELPGADLPIDPYLLGVWLGDGTSATMAVTSSLEDQPWMRAELERLGYVTSGTSVPTLFRVRGVRGEFVKLGLVNDPLHNTHGRKHIPAAYMRASYEQRLSLLQGLIDTDGTVCRARGCSTFCNTNRELAEAVRELVRSLGVKAGWSESRAMLNGVDCGSVYRVSFYLAGSARLPRKAMLTRNQHRTPNTYIEVVPHGRADTVCIEVDSPSHLFLCGRSMTPTHNSTYASVVFPAWYMGRKKRRNVGVATYATDLAKKVGRRIRSIVKQPVYQRVFDTELKPDQASANEWALTNDNEFMGQGILAGWTGNRLDGLVVDDPVKNREEADSEAIQKKTYDEFTDSLRSRIKPGGFIVLIMTRWNENDLAGQILPEDWDGESGPILCRDGRVWEVLCIPAEAEENDVLGRPKGEMLWKEWFGLDPNFWTGLRANARTWSALYQQRPSPDDGTFFKREWFKRYALAELPEHLRIYGTSDYAVTEDGGDYTVLRKWGVDSQSNLWLLPGGYRAQETSDRWIEAQIDLIGSGKRPFAWFGEAGVIQKSIEPMLFRRMKERGLPCRMEWLPSIQDKPTRARGAQARAAMGMVFIPEGPEGDRILDEYVKFPAGKNDDEVDNLSLIGRALDMVHPAIIPPEKPQIQAPQGMMVSTGSGVAVTDMTWQQMMNRQPVRSSRV